jgi:type II secretion system protein N
MTPSARARLRRFVGYPLFFGGALLATLFLTFPYGVAAERIAVEAQRSGQVRVAIGSLGPGFLGIRATRISITPPRQEGQPAEPEPLVIDEVSVRPSLFPLGVVAHARVFGGTAVVQLAPLRARPRLDVRARGIDLSRANAKASVGIDLAGMLGGTLEATFDRADFSKTTGKLALSGEGLAINGGTLMQYDLPKIDLGKLDAELKIDQGKATVQSFAIRGNDVESEVQGEVVLAAKLPFSSLNLKVLFKPNEEFLKRNSFIQTGLNFAMSRDAKGFYTANVDRFLGNPRFSPVR